MTQTLAARILAALPQTQCTRCGYPDCAAYANAIASDGAAINQCPPGGQEGIERLSAVTGQPVTALNPENGQEEPRRIAVIDENWCIGCTLCLPVCPTDAILGTHKMMHTIIERYCTGCELCLPVCPVDCIIMENVTGTATGWAAWSQPQADQAQKRYELHSNKCNKDVGKSINSQSNERSALRNRVPANTPMADPINLEKKRSVVEAALTRARLKAG